MKLLFIAWDGPYVNYMSSLFLPIFSGLKKLGYEMHVMHFTWATQEKVNRIAESCTREGIPYLSRKVLTYPIPVVGKFLTLLQAHHDVVRFAEDHRINFLMPRGMIPSKIALRARRARPSFRLIFDADGLQIEERVDFAGLSKGSWRFGYLKQIEKSIVFAASLILTRSNRAIDFMSAQYGDAIRQKCRKVINGRDGRIFHRAAPPDQLLMRKSLGIPADAFVSVYCGSLGPQYGVPEMKRLHEKMCSINPATYWVVVSGNPDFLDSQDLPQNTIVRTVRPEDVPDFLSIANVAFALRLPAPSMMGVAPIKLGEYFLLGLPVISSMGIGDTEALLKDKTFCFLLKNFSEEALDEAASWAAGLTDQNQELIRTFGEQHFGLEAAVASYADALCSLKVEPSL